MKQTNPVSDTDRDINWSNNIKIAGGYVCQDCGELDKEFLESHHKKPKHLYPELQHELKNGECICLWRHCIEHFGNPAILVMILLRLVILLTKRLYRPLSSCQAELEAINGE